MLKNSIFLKHVSPFLWTQSSTDRNALPADRARVVQRPRRSGGGSRARHGPRPGCCVQETAAGLASAAAYARAHAAFLSYLW